MTTAQREKKKRAAYQQGVCAICRQEERPGRDGLLVRLSVGHCHREEA